MSNDYNGKKRSELPDSVFGIPQERKYPMPDEKHTRSAIKLFNHVEPKYEEQLAKAVIKNMKKYNIDGSVVGPNNRLRRYLPKDMIKEYVEEACKDLTHARKLCNAVRKLARKYNANYFFVTDGASSYSNGNGKYNPAAKEMRDHMDDWERNNGFNPDDDWTNDINNVSNYRLSKESSIEEGFLKSDKDIYYNKDKFDSGEINLCFITGLSGSGKSTMGRNMTSDKVEHYEMDDVICNDNFSDDNLKEYGGLISSFFKGSGKSFRLLRDDDSHNNDVFKSHKNYEKEITQAFVKHALSYCKSHKNTKFICDGIWVFMFINPSQLKDCAVYIKGTSSIKSGYRALKRDIDEDKRNGMTSLQIFKHEFKRVKEDVLYAKENQKELKSFRSYFEKQSTNESVSSTVSKDHKQKGNIKLSSLKKVRITEYLIDKYKKEYPVLRHVRCKDTDEYVCDGYMWFKDDNLVCYVGSCQYTDDNTKWIVSLEILPEYRGYGLSTQILDFCVKSMKCKYLSVNKNNELAKKIYDKYGFKVYHEDKTMYYMTLNNISKNSIGESADYNRNSQDTTTIKMTIQNLNKESHNKTIYDPDMLSDTISAFNENYNILMNELSTFLEANKYSQFTGDEEGRYKLHGYTEDIRNICSRYGYDFIEEESYDNGTVVGRIVPMSEGLFRKKSINMKQIANDIVNTIKPVVFDANNKMRVKVDTENLTRYGYYVGLYRKNKSSIKEETRIEDNKLPKHIYHISYINHDGETFEPRTYDNDNVKNGMERKVKRVCFSDSITRALYSIFPNGAYDADFYVHVPNSDCKVYKTTSDDIYDADITHELWIKEPVQMKCIGKIHVNGVSDKTHTIDVDKDKAGYGKKKYHETRWNWVEKYEKDETLYESYISEDDDMKKLANDIVNTIKPVVFDADNKMRAKAIGLSVKCSPENIDKNVISILILDGPQDKRDTDDARFILDSIKYKIEHSKKWPEMQQLREVISKITLGDGDEGCLYFYINKGKLMKNRKDLVQESSECQIKQSEINDMKTVISSLNDDSFKGFRFTNISYYDIRYRSKKPIAFITIRTKPVNNCTVGYVSLAVDPKYQNQGIGKSLTEKAIQWFKRERGIDFLEWWCLPDNEEFNELANADGVKERIARDQSEYIHYTMESSISEYGTTAGTMVGSNQPDSVYIVNYMQNNAFSGHKESKFGICKKGMKDLHVVGGKYNRFHYVNDIDKFKEEASDIHVYRYKGKPKNEFYDIIEDMNDNDLNIYKMITGREIEDRSMIQFDGDFIEEDCFFDEIDAIKAVTEAGLSEVAEDLHAIPILTEMVQGRSYNYYRDINGVFIQHEITGLRSKSYETLDDIPEAEKDIVKRGYLV